MIDVLRPAPRPRVATTRGGTWSCRVMPPPEPRLLPPRPQAAGVDFYRPEMVDGNVLLKATADAPPTGFEVIKTRDGLEPEVRSRAEAQPIPVASALLLGHRSGTWGDAMFRTWCGYMLDESIHLRIAAWPASRSR